MTVNDVYTEVCDALAEPLPTGLSLGILTVNQFLDEFAEVIDDFCQKAGLVRKLFSIAVSSGVASYTVPDQAMHVQEVFYKDRYLYRSTGMGLDDLSFEWKNLAGAPVRWHEDRLAVKTLEVSPTPDTTGYTVGTSTDFYGTISSTATADDDFDFTSTDFYGTIGDFAGAVYLEVTSPMYGIIGNLVPSTGNLTLIATTRPPKIAWVLADPIEVVPDEFAAYLKYGVLAKVFSMDSETKDALRARYCGARYQEGIALAKAVSTEVMEDLNG